MTFMPIVMGFFLYNYAAGLSLYMITQSGLGVFEQKFIKKHWPIDDAEVETKKSGCGPLAGFMENLAEKQKEHMKRMEAMQKSKTRAPAKGRKRRR
jgi:membrane protein insertase Oxa1/YidC/SpoIIIJ